MKKFSKIVSALFLSCQAFLSTPLSVLADEKQPEQPTEQVQPKPNEGTETTESSSAPSSDSATSQTSESHAQPSSETTTQPSSSATETKPSEETTPSSQEPPVQPVKPVEPEQPAPQPAQPVHETPVTQPESSQGESAVATPQQPSPTRVEGDAVHFEKNESVESFIRKIGESARKIGKEHDLYASVMIAQAILESASGQSQLAQAPHYNLFGIKGSHKGKSVSFATQEDLGEGTMYTTQAGFRVYENYEDCFSDYATLLKEGLTGNSHFYEGVWKSNAKTYQEATAYLTGRYATDSQYDQKLNGLIETYQLTDYDKEVQGVSVNATGFAVPLNNYTITSPFGARGGEFHRGLDMAAGQGEPIHASKAGTVTKAEFHSSWGNYVVIEHADGMTTLYAHQAEYVVKTGDHVEQGQVIGYVGSTGNSTGAHLHVEVCQDSSLSQGMLLDPQQVLFGN